MACISSNRVCSRVHEKLCQFLNKNFNQQQKRNIFTINYKSQSFIQKNVFGSEGILLRNYKQKVQAYTPCLPITAAQQCTNRKFSSVHTQQPAGPLREYKVDPYTLLDDDLRYVYEDIRSKLQEGTSQAELETISKYYFDGQGKALRPMVAMLMARAINFHMQIDNQDILHSQRQVALISEMIHSASLIHDDVIDQSNFRRGKPSVNVLWNHKKVTMAGDYILSVASMMIASLKNDDVTIYLSRILTELVQGEFMQLGSKETENERFAHYLTKTYRKTASLIANTLKSVSL
jgi:decaprenyl-diphosphate synthase subunit 1